MSTVRDVLAVLEDWAPLSLAESWDNVGLLAGNGSAPVKKALVTLDITEEACEEAAEKGAQLLISHHPVIFHPLKTIGPDGVSAPAWRLARLGLSAICMHTNLDIAPGGVNDVLLRAVGLEKTGILQPIGRFPYQKITVFVPKSHAEAVRESMAEAGAGRYGQYDRCAFSAEGKGCFRPLAGSHPYLGKKGRLETADEVRVEMVCDARTVPAVVAAMKAAHPYETPAYDLFDDAALGEPYGLGRLGRLAGPVAPEDFAKQVKAGLNAAGVALHDARRPVKTAAVCSGAWDGELTPLAVKAGADTILTGEIKHSDLLAAAAAGLNVAAAGHFATEQPVCAEVVRRLGDALPEVSFEAAASSREVVRYI